jgi:hypothetical protein
VRYPRLAGKDEPCAKLLGARTLTNLYNQRPTWLDLAHRKVDAAVFAAYGWEPDLSDDEIPARLLAQNRSRKAAEGGARRQTTRAWHGDRRPAGAGLPRADQLCVAAERPGGTRFAPFHAGRCNRVVAQ